MVCRRRRDANKVSVVPDRDLLMVRLFGELLFKELPKAEIDLWVVLTNREGLPVDLDRVFVYASAKERICTADEGLIVLWEA